MTAAQRGAGARPSGLALGGLAIVALAVAAVGIAGPASGSEPTPASSTAQAPSASPSSEALLPGLVIELVADGVWRVAGDDAGHRFMSGRVREVEPRPDGSAWVAQGRRVVQLGRPGALEPRDLGWRSLPRRLSADSDGMLWAQEDGGVIVSDVDGRWRSRDGAHPSVRSSLSMADGQAWRVATDGTSAAPQTIEVRGATGWRAIEVPDVARSQRSGTAWHMAEDAQGWLWLGADRGPEQGWLASYADGAWSPGTAADEPAFRRVRALTTDREGRLWLLGERGSTCPDCEAEQVLARHDDRGWEVYGAAQGMPQEDTSVVTSWSPWVAPPLVIDDQGAAWFSLPRVGLFRFEGGSFDRIDVQGVRTGALDLSLHPDGYVWVASLGGALFLIDGSAVEVSAQD